MPRRCSNSRFADQESIKKETKVLEKYSQLTQTLLSETTELNEVGRQKLANIESLLRKLEAKTAKKSEGSPST